MAKKTSFSIFVYSDYSPAVLNSSPGQLGNGWGVCAMSYGTYSWGADKAMWDTWHNNTCMCTSSAKFYDFNGCHQANPLDGNIPLLAGNTFASDDGGYKLHCQSATWDLAQAQAAGVDVGSVVEAQPFSIAEIQQMAHSTLGF